jgi:zinc protease
LNRVSVNELKNFFMRWYGPDNATLTVGGDVNTMDVLRLAEKYFLPIPPGQKKVGPLSPVMLSLDKDRYISGEDQIRFPLLYMVYPTVPGKHKDEAALDCLSEIIGGGSNSLLYKNLDKKRIALQSGASHPCRELAGEFSIQVLPLPGKTLADMEKIVRETFVEFEKRGVTDEDLERFIAGYESSSIRSLAQVSGKVSQLAAFETFYGNPNLIQEEIDRRKSVTKADVMRVYNTYIKGKGAVILSWVPKGEKKLVAAPDNFKIDSTKYVKPTVDEYAGLTYTEPKDNFDRSKRPASGANPVVKVPQFWNQKWKNGIKVIGAENTELPTVGMLITLKGGHMIEQNMKGKAGIANIFAQLMNESTEKFSTEEFESQEIVYGANISVSSSNQSMSIYMDALTNNVDGALALLEERMFHPRFAPDDFERIKQQTIEGIENNTTQPTAIAGEVFSKLLYGKDHIFAIPASGTVESVKSITLDDVKKFYADYFSAATAEIVIVGNVKEKDFTSKLDFLKNWEAKPVVLPTLPATPAAGKTKIFLVDKEKAPQSEIRMGYIALPYDVTGEYYKANLMNFALGSAFNSRINLNLREDKGWTYGSRSGFRGSDVAGPFVSQAGVKGTATDSSLFEMIKEINKYRAEGITEEELEFTKKSIGQSEALEYETLEQKAGFLNQIQKYNLPSNYVEQQQAILNALTKEQVKALANKHLPVENMVILVVGDKAKIKKPLQRLGYEIVELDTKGEPVADKPKTKESPAPWR